MRMVAAALLSLSLLAACDDPAPNNLASTSAERSEEDAWAIVQRRPLKPYPQARTVKLFVESGRRREDGSAILISEAGQLLTSDQRAILDSSFEIVTHAGFVAGPACFIPHHFFRYYDAAGNQVGEIAVCFCCAQVGIDGVKLGERQENSMDHVKLERLVKDMGLPTDIECD